MTTASWSMFISQCTHVTMFTFYLQLGHVCSHQVYSLLDILIIFPYQKSLISIIKQCNITNDFTFLINVLHFWSNCPPLQNWPTFYGIFLEEMFIHKHTLKIQDIRGVTTQELPPLAGSIMHYWSCTLTLNIKSGIFKD